MLSVSRISKRSAPRRRPDDTYQVRVRISSLGRLTQGHIAMQPNIVPQNTVAAYLKALQNNTLTAVGFFFSA